MNKAPNPNSQVKVESFSQALLSRLLSFRLSYCYPPMGVSVYIEAKVEVQHARMTAYAIVFI